MSTGDVGHFDAAGRLFVDGRDDDMIVSGGENVFPSEVEDLLAVCDQIVWLHRPDDAQQPSHAEVITPDAFADRVAHARRLA